MLRRAGVRVMVDHFGRPDVARGLVHPGFQTLLELGREGNAVVKLSGPSARRVEGYPYRDVDPFVAAVIQAFTLDHCVWGSDWPFVRVDERMDYGPPLVCLARWLPIRPTGGACCGTSRPGCSASGRRRNFFRQALRSHGPLTTLPVSIGRARNGRTREQAA